METALMTRLELVGLATLASAAMLSTAHHSIPGACGLLTVNDATTLAGSPMSPAPNSDNQSFNCRYYGAGGPGTSGVEITTRAYADDETAHVAFPRWVTPFPGPTPAGMPQRTTTAISGVGSEATVARSDQIAGIYFRRGSVLVKIGSHPPPSDAALTVTAKAVISRM
jgi:hypothetical protein